MQFFDLMQPMFVNGKCPGKKDFGVLENPGIWSLQVLEKSIFMSVRTLVIVFVNSWPWKK